MTIGVMLMANGYGYWIDAHGYWAEAYGYWVMVMATGQKHMDTGSGL